MSDFQDRLRALQPERLAAMIRGVEKESLRVEPAGTLADTPHPAELGSALKHPRITTDFSESQLEFVTDTHPTSNGCVDELTAIHQFSYRALGQQRLWVGSMPCELPAEAKIPIGRYGKSNIGRLKHVYRTGLSNRYGRRMQTISGIHYNWSLPGLGNEEFFGLIRNFRRHSFLLIYLFGASPAACASFFEGREHGLTASGGDTLHLPHATSLRMGRFGYRSDAQSTVAIDYNGLGVYARTLAKALSTPYPGYEQVGIRNSDGGYYQLSTTVLQIENELYGTIRPKRVTPSGERPLRVLNQQGVQYIEVRCMDLDPFEPVGIAASTMDFLDVFLLHCLLSDSPAELPQDAPRLAENQHSTAARGREPGFMLQRADGPVTLVDWSQQLLDECVPIAERLDAISVDGRHRRALDAAHTALADPALLPSARVLAAMREQHQGSYPAFVKAAGERSRDQVLGLPFDASMRRRFEAMTRDSLREQRRVEAADTMPFEDFRRAYLEVDVLGG